MLVRAGLTVKNIATTGFEVLDGKGLPVEIVDGAYLSKAQLDDPKSRATWAPPPPPGSEDASAKSADKAAPPPFFSFGGTPPSPAGKRASRDKDPRPRKGSRDDK